MGRRSQLLRRGCVDQSWRHAPESVHDQTGSPGRNQPNNNPRGTPMRKARIAKLAGIVAAIPMLTLATTTSAHADGYNIKWQNRATNKCLAWKLGGTFDTLDLHASDPGVVT